MAKADADAKSPAAPTLADSCQPPSAPINVSAMTESEIPAPLELHRETVRPEWIDYNGHMNVAYYVLAFDHATDELLDYLRLTHDHKAKANSTTFVADMNVSYKREVHEGDPLRFTTRVLACDEKRIHFWHEMYHATEGYLAATNELLSLHIDLSTRRVGPMPTEIFEWIATVRDAHARLPMPEGVGRVIGLRRKA
jgi:acyl-CoA thioester hydrolase